LPLLVLRKDGVARKASPPIVVGIAQGGKARFLEQRAAQVAACLDAGAVVVLPDVRATGETEPAGEGRGRTGGATSRSSTEQMLGETMIGRRLRDLRTVLAYLRGRDEFRESQIVLYGDGLVAANPAEMNAAAPLDAEELPQASEPMGATVCLLAGLYDDTIAGVVAAGGLASLSSILDEPYFYVPHDAIVPGLSAYADIADLVAAQSGRTWIADIRDGANRAKPGMLDAIRADVESLIPSDGKFDGVDITETVPTGAALAAWLRRLMGGDR
jgi:hypothetical protein